MAKFARNNKKAFNWKLPVAIGILLLCALATAYWWDMAQDQKETRALIIEDQEIASIHDGDYVGSYTYGRFTYTVSVSVRNYTITDIQILDNRTSKHAKMAEGVVQNVLKKGNVNVDVIAGATTTSKALLKAIEQALACNV